MTVIIHVCNLCVQTPHSARITVILNTNNGPGYPADGPDPLLQCIPALRKAGITLLGYVHTGYGARPASVVLRDIARWKAAYTGLQGIFLDEVSGWVRNTPPSPPSKVTLGKGLDTAALLWRFIYAVIRIPTGIMSCTCVEVDTD